MEKGILKEFIPQKYQGVHQTFVSERGTYYKFDVTFDCNGKELKGNAMSSFVEPKWKIGVEYTFEKKEFSSKTGNIYVNISKMKEVQQFSGGGKNNEAFVVQKCIEAAYESSLKFFILNPMLYSSQEAEDIFTSKIFRFLNSGTEQDKWIKIAAIRAAIMRMEASKISSFDIKLSSWLLETAESIAKDMNGILKNTLDNTLHE